MSLSSLVAVVVVPEEALVDRAPNRFHVASLRPADGQERAGGTVVRQAEPLVELGAESGVQSRQRGAEPDGAAGQQDVLDRREQRLRLLVAAALPAGDEEL